jgi:hypothetical protein
MAFYGYSSLYARLNETPDLLSDEIQYIKNVMKYLKQDQLEFIYALALHNASLEGGYVISTRPPYNGTTLSGNMSPSFFEHDLSSQMWKLIKLFLMETQRT